jgi:hypothetical protein
VDDEEVTKLVLDTPLGLASVEVTATYNLPNPCMVDMGAWFSFTLVRARTRTRFQDRGDGKVVTDGVTMSTEGFGKLVNADGVALPREPNRWWPLPVTLAAPLLGHALAAQLLKDAQ